MNLRSKDTHAVMAIPSLNSGHFERQELLYLQAVDVNKHLDREERSRTRLPYFHYDVRKGRDIWICKSG